MAIFISYRRGETDHVVGRIYDRIRARFPDYEVFFDVDEIPLGVNFVDHLTEWVDRCDIFLAIIGPDWDTGRLASSEDFVRIEVEAALAKRIPVIPVLVNGVTEVPKSSELPAPMADLAFRNGIVVGSGPDFNAHIEMLLRGLAPLVDSTAAQADSNVVSEQESLADKSSVQARPTVPKWLLFGTAGVVILAALLGTYWLSNPAPKTELTRNANTRSDESRKPNDSSRPADSSRKYVEASRAAQRTESFATAEARDITVAIYWHHDGFGLEEATRFARIFEAAGAQTTVLEHRDRRPPDSLFIGHAVGANLARLALLNLPYKLEYLFRPDYPETDGSGAADGRIIGIGYRSTHYADEREAKSEPLKVTPDIVSYLTEPGISNSEFQRRLKSVTGA